jgi:PqqD family protein of HPr-rel-A system
MRWGAHTARVHARSWDGELVVYHEYTGETHWLNPLAAVIFETIRRRGSCTAAELEAEIGPLLQDEDRARVTTVAESAISTLRQLQLVEPLPA